MPKNSAFRAFTPAQEPPNTEKFGIQSFRASCYPKAVRESIMFM